jgi:hypothetical protein
MNRSGGTRRTVFKHFLLHTITIVMKKHNIILTANIVLAAGAAGLFTYGSIKESRMHKEHDRQVQVLVDRFKACPDRFRDFGECYTQAERDGMVRQAEADRSAGRYLDAGRIYARLGARYETEAREMAGRCGEAGRKEITDMIDLRREAAERAGLR